MDGQQKIKQYLDRAFAGEPQTPAVLAAKSNLLAKMSTLYAELIQKGVSPEEAYQQAITSAGDIYTYIDTFLGKQEGQPGSREVKRTCFYWYYPIILCLFIFIALAPFPSLKRVHHIFGLYIRAGALIPPHLITICVIIAGFIIIALQLYATYHQSHISPSRITIWGIVVISIIVFGFHPITLALILFAAVREVIQLTSLH